ncbi:MAG: thiamine phosphate synthase [Chloroflexota bacterium]|nr:thiamine phosphate synthase [Chloroflexota bacterium]MDE2684082.1 thiamine phosphate synthase [Chloroflexota bacterium]
MAFPFGSNIGRLSHQCLCLVTDRRVCPSGELPGRVAAAVDGGVDIVQLRDKEMPGAALLELAEQLREVIAGRALLLVNERADVALAARADGVQLGEAAMPTGAVRAIMGEPSVIGRSVHSVPGACGAAESGADFLLVGTMFATNSHPGEEPSGPGLLLRIASAGVTIPMLGIGGITEYNAGQVIAAGASGVAVITSVLAHDDPCAAAQRLKNSMADAAAPKSVADREANVSRRV